MKKFCLAAVVLLILASSVHVESKTLGLSFQPNHGQAPPEIRFLARGDGYNLLLTPTTNRLLMRGVSVETRLVGANSNPAIRAENEQAGKVHYLRGNSSITDIPTYARVKYTDVYPGIDLVYYGKESRLEYDFIVQPGADPAAIVLAFDRDVTLDASGNLVLNTSESEVVQHKPIVYQTIRGIRKSVPGSYRLTATNSIGFELGDYDRSRPLIVDPILTYSTYLGGSEGDDDARAIATDAAGNVYVAGSTTSTNFQTAAPFQAAAGSSDPTLNFTDGFITKLNAAGNALVYSTYLGGSNDDEVMSLAVDSSGNVVTVGVTESTNFPTTSNAVRTTCNTVTGGACRDAFVARLNPTGSGLNLSTYLGGTGDDEARAVAVDTTANIYLAGSTFSTNFNVTQGALSTDSSLGGFVTKLSSSGPIVYSTYAGAGSGRAEIRGIAVDSTGSAWITGSTPSTTATAADVFVTKLNAAGSSAVFTNYIRGSKDETGNAIALDSAGNAYVTGQTASTNFTTTAGVLQAAFGGGPAFRSADAGSNWSTGSGITAASLYALAIAPTTPATLYAGADDETTGGVFKSLDGGANWAASSTGLTDTRVHALAADPLTPATVYAGTRSAGVFKTTNSGATWTATGLTNISVTAFAIDPVVPATIYAGTESSGVYKSINGGTSWTPVNNGLASLAVRTIAIHPATTATLYAGTAAGIYKTIDGGATWTSASSGLFDPNINVLVLDPRNPNTLFVATNSVGIFRSVNAGVFWLTSNGGLTSTSLGIVASALTLDPASGTFYAAIGEANVSRVFKSTNGTTWTPTSLQTSRMTAIAVDRANPNAVYATTVGGTDAFVAKWTASGTLSYSTYLGGYRDDSGNAIAVDASGNAYIAGNTSSANFPLSGAMQSTFGGGSEVVTDAFVTKLNTAGTGLSFSSYLGGASNDFGKGIAVDTADNAYIAGQTGSADFPTASPLAARPGLQDAFIAKIADSSRISYSVSPRGGSSTTSQGGSTTISVGYARIQPGTGSTTPSGMAIFGFRQGNVLVSEAAVPASPLVSSARIYAEVAGTVNTGIAIANPNGTAVTLTFKFTDANGQDFGNGTTTIEANSQIAKFLNEAPFSGGSSVSGTFTVTASAPVSVVALRGLTNERGEFLITTLPVSDLAVTATTEAVVFPHFADGGGWTTQIVMVNPTDEVMTGSIQFFSPGTSTGAGQPATVTIAGTAANTFTYSIPARSSRALRTAGLGTAIQVGSVRMTPSGTSRTPSGLGIFNFRNVSEAGVPALRSGTAFRLYAETAGATFGPVGSIQTGVAIANSGAAPVTVNFELTTLAGASTGLTGSVTVPASGQVAKFLNEIFTTLASPFQGVLRISTAATGGISVVGLRGRYNERGDFLITTTQPNNEATAASSTELLFPHFADGGGYTTQFIFYNGSTDQSSSGSLRFFSQAGQTLSLSVR